MMLNQHAELPSLAETTYWITDPQPGLLEIVYQHEIEPDPSFLFARTPLAELRNHGPILVRLSAQSSLLRFLKEAPDRFKGLLITTQADRSILLEHLQALLQVKFDLQRRALLRYYDPVVASYFWPSIEADETATWMGPIQKIVWYGGTWANKVERKLRWYELEQPHPANASIHTGCYVLSTKQQQALVNQNIEQFAFDWLRLNSPVPFSELMGQIHAGMAAGHEDQASLTAWLDNQNRYRMERQG